MIKILNVSAVVGKVDDHLIPCMWKKSFGLECFGCGMQRSMVLLFQGEFSAAFKMYPAIYTLILLFGTLLLHLKFNFKHGHKIILALFVTNIIIIITNYILKIT
ncbi:DUF2752 domain-containing protein [Paucihalobacter ruber]|uniref:DUF2752 domain-containing protein n=1 Tax=Paucihalobacter ruber TaxID=2567861 RepID=A0A506PFY2_9FLAO|nr:DUF2752 domain-containing protein [Paucihalobacter ruber]TPV32484.1 DUF2752 domain-containing protein [Paucihalobacter ruber]